MQNRKYLKIKKVALITKFLISALRKFSEVRLHNNLAIFSDLIISQIEVVNMTLLLFIIGKDENA